MILRSPRRRSQVVELAVRASSCASAASFSSLAVLPPGRIDSSFTRRPALVLVVRPASSDPGPCGSAPRPVGPSTELGTAARRSRRARARGHVPRSRASSGDPSSIQSPNRGVENLAVSSSTRYDGTLAGLAHDPQFRAGRPRRRPGPPVFLADDRPGRSSRAGVVAPPRPGLAPDARHARLDLLRIGLVARRSVSWSAGDVADRRRAIGRSIEFRGGGGQLILGIGRVVLVRGQHPHAAATAAEALNGWRVASSSSYVTISRLARLRRHRRARETSSRSARRAFPHRPWCETAGCAAAAEQQQHADAGEQKQPHVRRITGETRPPAVVARSIRSGSETGGGGVLDGSAASAAAISPRPPRSWARRQK